MAACETCIIQVERQVTYPLSQHSPGAPNAPSQECARSRNLGCWQDLETGPARGQTIVCGGGEGHRGFPALSQPQPSASHLWGTGLGGGGACGGGRALSFPSRLQLPLCVEPALLCPSVHL